jgi:hypothetical protein
MTIDILQEFFFWCSVINLGLFFFSLILFKVMHDFICRIHGKWYNLSAEKIDAVVYPTMVFYKICIFFFNVVPYFALRIIR